MKQFDKVIISIWIALALIFWVAIAHAQVLPNPTGVQTFNDGATITVGLRFTPKVDVKMTGIRFWKEFSGEVIGSLWDGNQKVKSGTFTGENGWAVLPMTEDLKAGKNYTVTYSSVFYSYIPGAIPAGSDLVEYTGSAFIYQSDNYPVSGNGSNYLVEPILSLPKPQCPDTMIMYVAVDPSGPADWKRLIEEGLTVALTLDSTGGNFMFDDSTTLYQATFGVAPPHIRLKDTEPRVYRFTRNYTINGKSQPVRFTLYKSGAWIRELRNAAGQWEIFKY